MQLIDKNSISRVNFHIHVSDWLSFEFETNEGIYVEEAETDFNLFRVFQYNDGTLEIYVANSEDYDIHENVTHLFNEYSIFFDCLLTYVIEDIYDATELYECRPELEEEIIL